MLGKDIENMINKCALIFVSGMILTLAASAFFEQFMQMPQQMIQMPIKMVQSPQPQCVCN
jgi:hypothetical protein